jgi:hypothetical protein
MKKTQLFSAEILINIFFFSIMFVTLLFIIEVKNKEFQNYNTAQGLYIKSNNIINLLTLSSGYPLNWSMNDVTQIGISDDNLIINENKLTKFINLINNNYSFVKKSFSIEENELFILIEYLNKTKIFKHYPGEVKNILVSKRKLLLNNELVILKVGVSN